MAPTGSFVSDESDSVMTWDGTTGNKLQETLNLLNRRIPICGTELGMVVESGGRRNRSRSIRRSLVTIRVNF